MNNKSISSEVLSKTSKTIFPTLFWVVVSSCLSYNIGYKEGVRATTRPAEIYKEPATRPHISEPRLYSPKKIMFASSQEEQRR